MSCGFTPDLGRMLDEMVVEEEDSAAKGTQTIIKSSLSNVGETKSKVKVTQRKDSKQGQNDYNWTKTYEKWDTWRDPEEYVKYENVTRKDHREQHAGKAQMGCNHDHSAEQKLMEMTTEEKVAICDELRVFGNLFFKHGQYQRAAFHYHKALVYFEYVFPDTDEEEAQVDALKLKVLLNFTACRLKTMHLDDAVHHANQALELDQDNVKALYRRAQAYRLKDEFQLAQEDIVRAIELVKTATDTPSADIPLMQEKKLLLAKMLAYKLRTKQVSSAMFGNGDKLKAPERFIGGDNSAGCDSDINGMTIKLSRSSGLASTLPCDEDLSTHQPSIRGLKELQTLIANLDS
ncbi:unnamed protein product [Peronospora belbahrii]|uniref:Uncharacterized protein n=1 Tax=Peronospora belbahrii TaxID=622444 RepID=A0AAU9L014_9STRA|nr:unnamed protein product [Peronospora belbahrii]CAH0514532.1 unnamed protein product [Peronospora belbahrii]